MSDTVSPAAVAQPPALRGAERLRMLGYLLVGIYFGIVLVKGQVADWFSIQQMFRLQAFHMYGVIGSAIVVAMVSIRLLRRFDVRASDGSRIEPVVKPLGKGQAIGGLLFGIGWAITGACPGPLFAQVGAGHGIVLVTIAAALAGTWLYGWLKPYLPD